MNPGVAEEFTAALAQVVEGTIRLTEWAPTVDIPSALGLSNDEWVQRRLMGRVALKREERRAIVDAHPEMSTRELGEALGVSHQTVANDRVKDLTPEATPEPADLLTPSEPVKDLTPSDAPHVTYNSGNDEWYTPPEYIHAARDVLGGIDLDPASSPAANKTVKAERFYSIDDDGLTRPWAGRVWMNPPYSTGLVDRFVLRLLDCYQSGEVPAAVVLTNNATDTRWWQTLARRSSAVCMLAGRIRFRGPDGAVAGAGLQGQTIALLGDDRQRFAERFAEFGVVL
jgi:phage N-6-adenine-methyltransferase